MDSRALLTADEYGTLTTPVQIEIGAYYPWGRKIGDPGLTLTITLDARPLAVLAESAALGNRVYEFFSIRNPGDLLHYLWVHYVDVAQQIIEQVRNELKFKHVFLFDEDYATQQSGLAFTHFDDCFFWQGDDTEPHAALWLKHRETRYWRDKLDGLFAITLKLQDRLRTRPDYLLQNELRLIQQGRHRRQYLADVERRTDLKLGIPPKSDFPDAVFALITELSTRDNVQSFSFPFTDFRVWRILVAEQVQRAQRMGLPPQEAYPLYGPDSGIREVEPEDWGGNIHNPYEGARVGDVFVLPNWRTFLPERAGKDCSLRRALLGEQCHYLLTPRDFGELESATRSVIGDWVLYESRLPYVPAPKTTRNVD